METMGKITKKEYSSPYIDISTITVNLDILTASSDGGWMDAIDIGDANFDLDDIFGEG